MSFNPRVQGADRQYFTAAASGGGTGLAGGAQVTALANARLFTVIAYLAAGSAPLWLQVFDAATPPANGDAPIMTLALTGGQTGYLEWGSNGAPMANGIFVGVSSTEALYNSGGVTGADAKFNVLYREGFANI